MMAEPYAAQINGLLQAESQAVLNSPRGTSLFRRQQGQPAAAAGRGNDDLARAMAESARASAPQANHDDDERLRLALAISQSAHDAAVASQAPSAAAPTTSVDLLREATRASEQAYLEQRRCMLSEVLGVLRSCSPILASYVDAHCGIFIDSQNISAESGDVEIEIFNDFRRTVDTLLSDLLSEVGLGLDEVARTLTLAREQPVADTDSGSLVEHLLAVESFSAFRRLMAQRNEAIHREARSTMPPRRSGAGGGGGGGDAGAPAPGIPLLPPSPLGSSFPGGGAVFEDGSGFATVNELEQVAGARAAAGRSGDTVEIVRIDRERDLPRSRLADALADVSRE